MNTEYSQTEIHQFIKAYVASKKGELIERNGEVFTIKYQNQKTSTEYTYEPATAREKKSVLISPGSPTFHQILKECLENGVLCETLLKPRGNFEELLKNHFKDSPFTCDHCDKATSGDEAITICTKPQPCYHHINNAKITGVKILKQQPLRYYQLYFSVTFHNKLRPKDEEIIAILIDENLNFVSASDFREVDFLNDDTLEIRDVKGKLTSAIFDKLRTIAYQELEIIVKEKLALFDLPLRKERKSKLRSFDKRLRKDHLEQLILGKVEFDQQRWQTNHEALLKREEETLATSVAVKFINLLVINTPKVKFEVNLDNNSAIQASIILGINPAPEVTCPICRNTFSEGYATQDSCYVCGNCIRKSIDTDEIYSKKAPLKLDETLSEYIEQDSGFVCSVCGKRHSRLLEFRCSYDDSSVCINHYELCDKCGKVFSKLNLSYTDEFQRHLCPEHAIEYKFRVQ